MLVKGATGCILSTVATDAEELSYQYSHCRLDINYSGPVLYRKVVVIGNNVGKWNNILKQTVFSIESLWYHNLLGTFLLLYRDNTWASWCLKSSPMWLLVEQLVRLTAEINALHYWPFVRKTTGDQWSPLTEGQYCGKLFHIMTSSWIFTPMELINHIKGDRQTPQSEQEPVSCLNIKIVFPIYADLHVKYKTVTRPSYL